jgi:VanZ family protein
MILGILVYRAIAPKVRPMVFAGYRLLASIGVVVLYGAIDELHQGLVPGRTVDILDLAADATGGVLAAACLFLYARWQARRTVSRGA